MSLAASSDRLNFQGHSLTRLLTPTLGFKLIQMGSCLCLCATPQVSVCLCVTGGVKKLDVIVEGEWQMYDHAECLSVGSAPHD